MKCRYSMYRHVYIHVYIQYIATWSSIHTCIRMYVYTYIHEHASYAHMNIYIHVHVHVAYILCLIINHLHSILCIIYYSGIRCVCVWLGGCVRGRGIIGDITLLSIYKFLVSTGNIRSPYTIYYSGGVLY